jgi:hypothetical protein
MTRRRKSSPKTDKLWAFVDHPQFELPETLASVVIDRVETLDTGSRKSWVGNSRLAAVADQRPFNTCAANSSCRLLETVEAIRGRTVTLEAHQFHECVVGLSAMQGPQRISEVLIPLQEVGSPIGVQGSFIPGSQCPANGPDKVRAGRFARLANESDVKYWIANRSPVVAVISAERRFLDVADDVIYRDGPGPPDFNHALLLVGYDDEGGFWEVQNSFGRGWGIQGIGRIAFGHCGILRDDFHAAFCIS